MELSNKMLAWLVVASIVISLAGTMISLNRLNDNKLTGFAIQSNDTGTASVSIGSMTLLRFTIDSVSFGSGAINASLGECNMTVNGSATIVQAPTGGCIGFNTTVSPLTDAFILENAGTNNLNVTINVSKNATNFIGGTTKAPSFKYAISNSEPGSCIGGVLGAVSGWNEVVENASVTICNNLSWSPTNNTLRMGIFVSIPADASGSKTVTVTAQGTSLS
jgi:hypothetical protein